MIESKPFGKDRAGFEQALQAALDEHSIELICLAGFMRLFTAEFVQRWHGRMLNIHPSLLPSFPGLDPHGQALRAGVKISGATVHFVIPETDAGPIVMQGAVPVSDDDTAETLAERILDVEHRIYPAGAAACSRPARSGSRAMSAGPPAVQRRRIFWLRRWRAESRLRIVPQKKIPRQSRGQRHDLSRVALREIRRP